jgi:hypothetical protein
MPFVNSYPKPKIYSQSLAEKTMKYYSWFIAKKFLPHVCFSCGAKEIRFKLHVHHKNKNRWDNRLKNLQVLCVKCHHKMHYPKGRYGNLNPFWHKTHSLLTKRKIRDKRTGTVRVYEKDGSFRYIKSLEAMQKDET